MEGTGESLSQTGRIKPTKDGSSHPQDLFDFRKVQVAVILPTHPTFPPGGRGREAGMGICRGPVGLAPLLGTFLHKQVLFLSHSSGMMQ